MAKILLLVLQARIPIYRYVGAGAALALYVSPDLRLLARHHFMVPAMPLALAALWLLAREPAPGS